MKKLFVMFVVSALFTACGTDKSSENEKCDSRGGIFLAFVGI